jgi:hypothetical protein
VRVEASLAVGLAPDEADREPAAPLTAGRLVANAALQAGANEGQLRLRQGPLEPQQQPVGEQRRVIQPVGLADQGIGYAAQVEQTMPVGVVAG